MQNMDDLIQNAKLILSITEKTMKTTSSRRTLDLLLHISDLNPPFVSTLSTVENRW